MRTPFNRAEIPDPRQIAHELLEGQPVDLVLAGQAAHEFTRWMGNVADRPLSLLDGVKIQAAGDPSSVDRERYSTSMSGRVVIDAVGTEISQPVIVSAQQVNDGAEVVRKLFGQPHSGRLDISVVPSV